MKPKWAEWFAFALCECGVWIMKYAAILGHKCFPVWQKSTSGVSLSSPVYGRNTVNNKSCNKLEWKWTETAVVSRLKTTLKFHKATKSISTFNFKCIECMHSLLNLCVWMPCGFLWLCQKIFFVLSFPIWWLWFHTQAETSNGWYFASI